MSMIKKLIVLGGVIGLTLGGAAIASERGTNVSLPDKAAAAFKAAFPTAKVVKVQKETEHGVEIYGIEFKDAAGERDCDVTPDGTILEISQEIDDGMLPKPVLATFNSIASGVKLEDLERTEVRAEAKGGLLTVLAHPVVRYEAKIEKAKRFAEIVVGEDGTIVTPPVWTNESRRAHEEKD